MVVQYQVDMFDNVYVLLDTESLWAYLCVCVCVCVCMVYSSHSLVLFCTCSKKEN